MNQNQNQNTPPEQHHPGEQPGRRHSEERGEHQDGNGPRPQTDEYAPPLQSGDRDESGHQPESVR
jgi:hypothetical protein